MKLQSAMEYLMTYGWAILIIAVVLAALFELGIFNPNAFAPKAAPGGCKVVKEVNPGAISFASLEGACTGQLPQYVAQFVASTSNVLAPASVSYALSRTNSFSEFAWIYPKSVTNAYPTIISMAQAQLGLYNNAGTTYVVRPCISSGCWTADARTINAGQWSMVGFTYDHALGVLTVYINGIGGTPQSTSASVPGTNTMCIGSNLDTAVYGDMCTHEWGFQGDIVNVQIYNASLSANDIASLYNEGIGGVPKDINYLVGWWPLNGDAKDYSGNGNDGIASAISYTGSWASSYAGPS